MTDMPVHDRPSRQQFVVPPRHTYLPAWLGAVACGCVGFGLVWAVGSGGRTADIRDVAVQIAAHAPEAASPPDAAKPGLFPVGDEPIRELPAGDRWQPRGGAAEDPAPVPDRYARQASLDLPAAVIPVSGEERPWSRSSTTDVPEGARGAEAAPDAAATTAVPFPAAAVPSDVDPPMAMPPASPALAPEDAEPPPSADPQLPAEPAAALPPATVASDEPTAPATADEPPESPPVSPFAAAPAAPFAAAAPAIPDHPPARPVMPDQNLAPPPAGISSATAALPYAAAPPLVPGMGARNGSSGGFASPAPPRPDTAGQGRPGPVQLEGIQTPQLALEKRGPREVQVGKPARYEILVRNVGGATAHEVTLRDAVPFGTALVATVPPASAEPPAATAVPLEGELIWALGTLEPGGQARVMMEVMPQQEGEIGSIASVSFRADATIRSRATKPALQITASEPRPVLIGRDTQLTITVSNPGSGAATGVVLEGFLPENVSHRAGGELEFDVGQLRPGESRTIDLVLGTRAPGVQQARFTARADGGVEAEHGVKLEVTAPTLELAVDMPLRRFLQRPATCKVAMMNAGTAPARAVELAAQLPPGLKFVRANNAGWHDDRTNRVLWNLEELPPGETGTVEVVVMPIALGPQKIIAAARSADGLADQVAHVCEVEGLAAVSFEVLDSEDPIEVGGVTEYVIRVGNQGTKPATGIRVTASLLGDLEPVEAQGPAGHRVENRGIAFEPLVKLAPSEEAVFRIRARGGRAGDQRVQVQVVSEDHPAPITKEELTRVYDDR
jgi:uncharacterized repeat protein (TIGR01451 family)